MAKTKIRPQTGNLNKHTAQGTKALGESVDRDGLVDALTVAANGGAISGSNRIVKLGDVLERDPMIVDAVPGQPVIVKNDGTSPIINMRVDIANDETPQAKRLSVAANAITVMDFAPDTELLASLMQSDSLVAEFVSDLGDSLAALNADAGLRAMVTGGTVVEDPMAEWQGMPEYGNTESAFKSIAVHFANPDDVKNFAEIIEQEIGEKTKYIWYPKRERQDLKSQAFVSES